MAALPDSLQAVLTDGRVSALRSVVGGFDREQLIWSSGYLAGLAEVSSDEPATVAPHLSATPVADRWHIYYATETGNSERVARQLADRAQAAGVPVELVNLRDVRPRALEKINRAVFVLATHGVGEPPEGTEAFFSYWLSDDAPSLASLQFGVVALGDSSYADYCQVGRDFEARLLALGATSVLARADCDLDYEKTASSWADRFAEKVAVDAPAMAIVTDHPAKKERIFDRGRPFAAEVLLNQKITGRDSTKDVRHIELSLEGSGLVYQPGDSLGVKPENSGQLVDAVVEQAGLDGDSVVVVDEESLSLRQALTATREITLLSRPVLDLVAEQHDDLRETLSERDRLAAFLASRQLVDLLAEYPCDWQPQQLVDTLRGLTPRLYSIASSPDANPGEAHLTVGVVRYRAFGRDHWGSASSFLAGKIDRAPVYVEANDRFRLPADGDAPIIMIGAGTGIAPYRAFVEHRRERGHRGRNWLFFGDRNRHSDFLYQTEWLHHRKDGRLHGLDVAFSRDQADKVYIQQRLVERSADVYAWLMDGAHLYVCGDAETLAVDVHAALRSVVSQAGRMSVEHAEAFLARLRSDARYQRDVY